MQLDLRQRDPVVSCRHMKVWLLLYQHHRIASDKENSRYSWALAFHVVVLSQPVTCACTCVKMWCCTCTTYLLNVENGTQRILQRLYLLLVRGLLVMLNSIAGCIWSAVLPNELMHIWWLTKVLILLFTRFPLSRNFMSSPWLSSWMQVWHQQWAQTQSNQPAHEKSFCWWFLQCRMSRSDEVNTEHNTNQFPYSADNMVVCWRSMSVRGFILVVLWKCFPWTSC